MRFRLCLAAALLVPAAHAADKSAERPLIAPPPAWVLPAAIPPAPPAAAGAAVVTLLEDQQAKLGSEGTSFYVAHTYRIASPQGLDASALKLSWDPDLETLTIHRYRILRDGKVIDLIGDGSKLTVVRRETNLERATLDGRLTATYQPEGLQVGDVIDLAFTQTRHDPALGGHTETMVGAEDGEPAGRVRVRALWSAATPVHWRAEAGVIQPKFVAKGQARELITDLSNVTPPRPPKGAPMRFQAVNVVELSDFASWAEVSRLMGPLYIKSATLAPGGALQAEAAKIAATTTDPKARALAALKLVQEQVRYLFLGMADGGYVPAAADLTWSRRFGDCKGKTVVLLALLKQLGIEATPALASVEAGDWVGTRLPAMGAFDHVLVRAIIGGKVYWLDGTRLGDRDLDRIKTPPFRWALPVTLAGADLVKLDASVPTSPEELFTMDLDASQGIDLPARAKGSIRFEGEAATAMRLRLVDLDPADREKQLRDYWRTVFDYVTPTNVGMEDDAKTGAFVLTMTGSAKMHWSNEQSARYFTVDGAQVGFKFVTTRDEGPNRDAPFAVRYPVWTEQRETILLPNGGKGVSLQGGSVDRTVGGAYRFHREVTLAGGKLSMVNATRTLAPEFPAADAEANKAALASLADQGVYLRVLGDYRPTDAETAALKAAKPEDADGYLRRGATLFDRADYAGALADADAAIALKPGLASAHALRALTLAAKKDPRAEAAAARALQLDPKSWGAWKARSLLASAPDKPAEAEAAFTHMLELRPRDPFAYMGRSIARGEMRQMDGALSDADAALVLDPDSVRAHGLRVRVLVAMGRPNEALADLDKMVAGETVPGDWRMARAALRLDLRKPVDARADYEATLASKPTPAAYIGRARTWGPKEVAKRDADIVAALKLAPGDATALATHSAIAADAGRFAEADADLDRAIKANPKATGLWMLRSELMSRAGNRPASIKYLDEAIALEPNNPVALNNRCWQKAAWKIGARTAIADCDAALKLAPGNAGFLDSRAFARLRMGDADGAIIDYNAAIKSARGMAPALYGRGVAEARKGKTDLAMSDLAAARALNPKLDADFASYGMAGPPPPQLAAQPHVPVTTVVTVPPPLPGTMLVTPMRPRPMISPLIPAPARVPASASSANPMPNLPPSVPATSTGQLRAPTPGAM